MSPTIPERLRAFYAEHQDQLYTYAMAITHHREAAEDAIHQAFHRLLQRDSLPTDLRPYIFRCVRNAALDTWRHDRGRTGSLFDNTAPPADLPAPAATPPPLSPAEAEAALAALSPDERETIVLKIYDDFSFQEIADLRGIPLSTASSWYRRGLAKLRTFWIKETA
jgi:RNA polymerase sigma-70 factor (ECF subfamily)